MIDDRELDMRLASLARAVDVDDATLNRLAADARADGHRGWRARLIALGSGVLVVLAAAITVTPVAADALREFLAIAEWYPEPGGEILPDSEWVDIAAPDLREYVESIYPDYLVLGPGQTREQVVSDVVGHWDGLDGVTQEVGLRLDMEMAAFCGWAQEWRAAYDSGDPDRAEQARDAMLVTTTWPAQAATNGGGIVDHQRAIVDQAVDGRVSEVAFGVSQSGCGNYPASVGE